MKILVINCGSSSLKYQVIDSESEQVLCKGLCERIGIDGRIVYQKAGLDKEINEIPMPTHKEAVAAVIDAITKIGSLYYKGEIIPCEYEDCNDLEVVAAWDRHHVVDRIMGDKEILKRLGRPINPYNS